MNELLRWVSASLCAGLVSLSCGCAGEHTASASAGVTGAVQYATSFEQSENPISEGGRWRRAKNSWTSVRTAAGNAFGTNGAADRYDDSYALLSGFGPDQQAEGVIHRSPGLARGITHEVELLLRFTDGAGFASGYECLFAYFGGVQIVRWNGAMGDFTVLKIARGPERIDRELQSGDRIKASIVGDQISLYINDVLMAQTRDDAYTGGQPGISFFTRPGGNSADFALTEYSVSSN
jgi:hypothetical protein